MHFTTSPDQAEILHSISKLFLDGKGFHVDTCYGKGGFYARGAIPKPEVANDLFVTGQKLWNFDVQQMPFDTEAISSVIFDPPFLIGNPNGGNVMVTRYGCFRSADEFWMFQNNAIAEISRVLLKGGILVTKVQDFVHGGQKYFPSIYQVNKAKECDLDLVESFILISRNSYRNKGAGCVNAISSHCTFHVFRKIQRARRIVRY